MAELEGSCNETQIVNLKQQQRDESDERQHDVENQQRNKVIG